MKTYPEIVSYRQIGLKQTSEAPNISYKCVYHIVRVELVMGKISAKWIWILASSVQG